MKKITLLFLMFSVFHFMNAQDTCATATVITAGTYTVTAVDGTEVPNPECAANAGGARTAGEWYIFTATVDGYATVTTDVGNTPPGGDTRLHIFEGSCTTLSCIGGNDDIDPSMAVQNYLSSANVPITSGVSYYIAFDDRWSAAGFDFELSETAYSCEDSFPYSDDVQDELRYEICYTTENSNGDALTWTYNTINDLDGDGTNDNIMNVFPPDPTLAKDDWLFTTALEGSAGSDYTVTLVYNGIDVRDTASEDFEIVALSSPSSTATTQEVLGSFTDITQSGVFGDTGGNDLITQAYSSDVTYTPTTDGPFYIGIHATTPVEDSDVFVIISLNISQTLSVDEFATNLFEFSFNKATDQLILDSSNLPMHTIEIYSILGRKVKAQSLYSNNEAIDMASFADGIYLAKVSIGGQIQTIKFIKS
ncbi:T9SS type A sorting domain-containing protein [Psychroserpens sp.]|uniref:T9SS type A sorting domain-containing protein n=1 Tax=Psychroserpens sp. TaxID=2020870 RepID=UPI003C74F146